MKSVKMLQLMAMMFVQNMIFPIWFNTIVPYVQTFEGGKDWVPFCGVLMGLGMLASPVVCMFADRFLDAGKVLALCNFAAAGALGAATLTDSPAVLCMLLLVSTVFLMPTWSVVAALTMAHTPTSAFPYIRACGSIGWAASAVFSIVAIRWLRIENFETSYLILATASAVSLFAGLLALTMPATPPKAKGTPVSVVDAFGLKAFVLLKDRSFLVLSLVILLSMVAFQWYMGYNTLYLQESGFTYLNLTQNLGQVAELGFMMLLPVMFRKLPFKTVLLIGFSALAFRYTCFTVAVLTGVHALDFGGILIHGLIFGAIVMNVQMYVAERAPEGLKNQAQGLVMILTTGIGDFLSVAIFYPILMSCAKTDALGRILHNWTVPFLVSFGIAILSMALLAAFFREKAK